MGDVIELLSSRPTRDDFFSQLNALRAQLDELDAREPEDINSEKYEQCNRQI